MGQITLSPVAHEEIDRIAATSLGIETLETRRSDRLDFHDLAVWNIRAALEAAYLAGMVDHVKTLENDVEYEVGIPSGPTI